MITQERIDDFNTRIQLLINSDSNDIVSFPEIRLTEEQMEIIADPMFSWTKDTLIEYYKGKIHGEILLSSSAYTTREDQPDFQYLVDLGIKALKAGMEL